MIKYIRRQVLLHAKISKKGRRGLTGALPCVALKVSALGMLGAAALVWACLYFMQEGLIFPRQGLSPHELERIRGLHPEAVEVTLTGTGGVVLHGWFVKGESRGPSPLLIYFGGNAEEVSSFLPEARRISREGWSVVFMNYRGYGLSNGRPGEKEFFDDALLIYDTFTEEQDVKAGLVALMGRSLGTGVAVYLASMRPASGVVLISPYDSLRSVARRAYPFVPVSALLRHHFDSASRAPGISAPLLALVAEKDDIIPPALSLRLLERWGGRHTMRVIEGVDHNSIIGSRGYIEGITGFLRGLKNAPSEGMSLRETALALRRAEEGGPAHLRVYHY